MQYTFILSSVEYLKENTLMGYENITKYHLVKETEYYTKNVTDADGNIFLTRAERDILIPFRDNQNITLGDGSIEIIPFINYKYSWINVSYIETTPIYEELNGRLLLVKDRPTIVKVCSSVTKGQLLIAGLNGCAEGINFPTQRYFAIAAEDSHDGIVGALVGWN